MSTFLVLVTNHFDPLWRRCWDKRIEAKGKTYASYADIEEYYMLDHLELARRCPDYKFEAESAIVLEKFLERHPERRDELRALADANRFAVPGTGYVIVDANMIRGESLVRNFVLGLLSVEETTGRTAKRGMRTDGFGNSAQIPQIFRGCGIAWVNGLSYAPVTRTYWRGLDGSAVCRTLLPGAGHSRGGKGPGWMKYFPCPACNGTGDGCDACNGRGIDAETTHMTPPGNINEEAAEEFGAAIIGIGGEETLPCPELIDWYAAEKKKRDIRFVLSDDLLPYVQSLVDKVDDPPEDEIHDGVELNPTDSGCLVTRIRTKQEVRRLEHAAQQTEALCSMAALKGAPYPAAELAKQWRKMLFAMFHDCITATHTDPAYEELSEFWAQADAGLKQCRDAAVGCLVSDDADCISVINGCGHAITQIVTACLKSDTLSLGLTDDEGNPVPVLAVREADAAGTVEVDFVAREVGALGARSYTVTDTGNDPNVVTPLPGPVIENERFRIEADDHGIVSVHDKKLGANILEQAEHRPGELILEHDEGSPWETLGSDQTRLPLADATRLVAAETRSGLQRLVFSVRAPHRTGFAVGSMNATVTVTLTSGIERVDFRTEVEWHAWNHRLRTAMPIPFGGRHLYEIPYGVLERRPYKPRFGWHAANGDWPTINWAGVDGTDRSVAVINKGLPSYRIDDGPDGGATLFVSVLRSPSVATHLCDNLHDALLDNLGGMRDFGVHTFEYAVTAYDCPLPDSSAAMDAESYNAALTAVPGGAELPEMPSVESGNARLTCLKQAEDGNGFVLRLHEFRGNGGDAVISVPDSLKSARKVNLLEREGTPLEIRNGRVKLALRPWEIATLRLV